MTLRRLLAHVTALTVLATPLAAQRAPAVDSLTLPRELLEALLGFGIRAPNITVGRLPEGFPAALVRAPGEALGGASFGREGGVAVLVSAAAPDSAVRAVEARLASDGWTTPGRSEDEGRGFVGGFGGARPRTMCRGGEALFLSAMPRRAGGSRVHVSRGSGDGCAPDAPFGTRSDAAYADLMIPALTPPTGARTFGSGGGSSGGERELRVRLETELGADSVAGHYGAQLVRAGWRASGEARTQGFAARVFAHRDASGRGLHAVLTVAETPGEEGRDVRLRVQRLRAASR